MSQPATPDNLTQIIDGRITIDRIAADGLHPSATGVIWDCRVPSEPDLPAYYVECRRHVAQHVELLPIMAVPEGAPPEQGWMLTARHITDPAESGWNTFLCDGCEHEAQEAGE